MIEKQITKWARIDRVINSSFGNVNMRDLCARQIPELQKGNNRDFVVKYDDILLQGQKEKYRCCAIFELIREETDDEQGT